MGEIATPIPSFLPKLPLYTERKIDRPGRSVRQPRIDGHRKSHHQSLITQLDSDTNHSFSGCSNDGGLRIPHGENLLFESIQNTSTPVFGATLTVSEHSPTVDATECSYPPRIRRILPVRIDQNIHTKLPEPRHSPILPIQGSRQLLLSRGNT